MERLGKWRDKGTGVNPFIRREEQSSLRLLLGLLRLPFYYVVLVLYSMTKNYLIGRLMLFLAGVKHLEVIETFVCDDIIRTYSDGKMSSKPQHNKGDYIICNSVCWLDKLILSVLFPDGLLLFPEGCMTNNRGILKLQPEFFEGFDVNTRIRLAALKYNVLPSQTSHYSYPNASVVVRTLSPEALWQATAFPSPTDTDKFAVQCQQKLAALGHLKPLQMDLNDYLSFQAAQ